MADAFKTGAFLPLLYLLETIFHFLNNLSITSLLHFLLCLFVTTVLSFLGAGLRLVFQFFYGVSYSMRLKNVLITLFSGCFFLFLYNALLLFYGCEIISIPAEDIN